jgi:hypothetical protein
MQTTSNSGVSGEQNEDAAKEIADLKKQLEQAKKTQRDFGIFFFVLSYVLILISMAQTSSKNKHPRIAPNTTG